VTLLDAHAVPFDGASSTDVSKLVRMDYGSDEFYHGLAERALEGWERWNAEWPRPLYHEEGLLVLARGAMTPGGFEQESWRVLRERGHEPERLTPGMLAERFPAWQAGAYEDGYFNARAGWAESAAVVERLLALAEEAGVRRSAAAVRGLVVRGSRAVGVRTASGDEVLADRVVVCTGAWTPKLLPWLADMLRATAQPVLYLRPDDPRPFRGRAFPPWAADIARTGWYGFPALADGRVKVGHHGPGARVDPDMRGEVSQAQVERGRDFLRGSLPGLAEAPLAGTRVCLYCDTPDGDFLIDADPDHEGLVVATGGAGHAFKFAPLLGPLIADAVEDRPSAAGSRFQWRTGRRGKEEARYSGD